MFTNGYSVTRLFSTNPSLVSLLLALISGAMSPLGFAPYDLWPVSLLSMTMLAVLLNDQTSTKTVLQHVFVFALGYYGVGVSWIFISIYYFGDTALLLSLLMTAAFVAFIALLFSLPFYFLPWFKPSLRILIGFPCAWIAGEWMRTWLLTGFPWLFIGYSHTDTPLSGWAPVGGVLLTGLISTITSSFLAYLFIQYRAKKASQELAKSKKYHFIFFILVPLLWVSGAALKSIPWTTPAGSAIKVGLVQPNIPQNSRWLPEFQPIIKQRLFDLSEPLWHNDWIIWPEGVLPDVYHRSLEMIAETEVLANQHNTTVVTGVLYDVPQDNERTRYYNSIIGIGDAEGIYHKQRLVPFGEYVPLEKWLRGLITFFDLPYSVISIGPEKQQPLRVKDYILANAICYEIAYPKLVAQQAEGAHVILTVSNDAWFGESIGPLQHFQMARMRAIETGRYIIRGTNNGVSAIIAADGEVRVRGEQFTTLSLNGEVIPMQGKTLFMRTGNTIVLTLLLIFLIVGLSRTTLIKRKN